MAVVKSSVTRASGAVGYGERVETSSLHKVESCDECFGPGDRMGTFTLWS